MFHSPLPIAEGGLIIFGSRFTQLLTAFFIFVSSPIFILHPLFFYLSFPFLPVISFLPAAELFSLSPSFSFYSFSHQFRFRLVSFTRCLSTLTCPTAFFCLCLCVHALFAVESDIWSLRDIFCYRHLCIWRSLLHGATMWWQNSRTFVQIGDDWHRCENSPFSVQSDRSMER